MKNWIRNGNICAEPLSNDQYRYGCIGLDHKTTYIGEMFGKIANGMGMLTQADGGATFGYFEDGVIAAPYIDFDKNNEEFVIVLEIDPETGIQRFISFEEDTGNFIYGERDGDSKVKVRNSFEFLFDEDEKKVFINNYGQKGDQEHYDIILGLRPIINKLFEETPPYESYTYYTSFGKVESLNDFKYRSRQYDDNKKTCYEIDNSMMSDSFSGYGVKDMPSDSEIDHFIIGEFNRQELSGWQFEHGVDGDYKDCLRYVTPITGLEISIRINYGISGGLIINFPQSWAPNIRYDTKGYLYITPKSSKESYSATGRGLRLDLANGEIAVINMVSSSKCDVEKYYHLDSWWSEAEGKKSYGNRKNPAGSFTNYIETHPEYFTKRHASEEKPKERPEGKFSTGMGEWEYLDEEKRLLGEPGSEGFGITDWDNNAYIIAQYQNEVMDGLAVARFDEQTEFVMCRDGNRYYPNCILFDTNCVSIRLGLDRDGLQRIIWINLMTGEWFYFKYNDQAEYDCNFLYSFNPKTQVISIKDFYDDKVYSHDRRIELKGNFIVKGTPNIFPKINFNDFKYYPDNYGSSSIEWREETSSVNSRGVGLFYREENGKSRFGVSEYLNHTKVGWVFEKVPNYDSSEVELKWFDATNRLAFCICYKEDGETIIEGNKVFLREYNGDLYYYDDSYNGIRINIDDEEGNVAYGKFLNFRTKWQTECDHYISRGHVCVEHFDDKVELVKKRKDNLLDNYFNDNPDYLSDTSYLYDSEEE